MRDREAPAGAARRKGWAGGSSAWLGRWAWCLTATAACMLACGASDPSSPTPETITDTAAWAGCEDYVEQECLLIESASPVLLRAWLDVPPSSAITIEIDGTTVPAEVVEVDGGTRVAFTVPPAARQVRVGGAARAALTLQWRRRDAAVTRAIEAQRRGDLDAMCAAMAQAPASLDPIDRIQLAKLRFGCGPRSDLREVVPHETEAAELASAHGLPRALVGASATIVAMCVGPMADTDCARRWLERMPATLAPELAVWRDYARGQLAAASDDLSGALAAYSAAERWALRLGMDAERDAAYEQRATMLGELGRVGEAVAAANAMYAGRGSQAEACARARVINNAAWPLQRLAEAGLLEEPPVEWLFEQAEIFEGGACDDARARTIALVNLASALRDIGDLDEAERWLATLLVGDLPPDLGDLEADIEQLRVDVALATNRWHEVSLPLLAGAAVATEPRLRWRALVQQAQVLERFGLELAALAHWREAESLLDLEVARIAVAGGRESFLTARRTSAEGLVEALVRAGANDEALCRIRLARGRAVRAADRRGQTAARPELARFDELVALRAELEAEASQDWTLPGDELARRRARREQRRQQALETIRAERRDDGAADPACSLLPSREPHEAMLAIQPVTGGTLAVLAAPQGTRVQRLPPIPDEDQAAAWLDAMMARFAAELRGVTALRALPVGGAWALPIHHGLLDGTPLVDRVAVAYALDLPRATDASPPAVEHALVVADPRDDLALARAEGEAVAASLRAAGWQVDLRLGAQAQRSAVLAALGKVELLHYAGHGVQRDDGWQAALLLDGGQTIEVVDVLAAPSVPRVVVLAGCQTGLVQHGLVDGGMNLGRAFLLAGAEAVIVGDGVIRDDDAHALAQALYEHAATDGFEPVAALRRAVGRAVEPDRAARWSAFRVVVR